MIAGHLLLRTTQYTAGLGIVDSGGIVTATQQLLCVRRYYRCEGRPILAVLETRDCHSGSAILSTQQKYLS